ncbi:DUF2855 domain-containing protein [Streptomyces spongiicola]|uniref:DUF2855 domain-containing protein n=1 Tax=Streptomyces spongiicola TaxID=1690221 RepID=A0A2S1Z3N3_9ACTN|nr:DUF2855 family protein [Streptomyces spongiicola]AWK10979.1 DUF2855 domain-containing protein [Streptomyces spongiicola]GBQ03556.1 DUF2855 domain-containing protein [Streptomyces spongiicola]
MPVQDNWDLMVRRDDLTAAEVRQAPAAPLRPGEVRLAAERFALTAITATYARLGESELPFFDAFAGPEGYGRVPTWGYARVEESRRPEIPVGARYFGFLPLSTHVTLAAEPTERGFDDVAPERDFLHPWYRGYLRVGELDPQDDHRLLLKPLYPASFNLAEFLVREHPTAAVLITSASSKTAVGLAALLSRQEGITTLGVTSQGNLGFVRGLGHYDMVTTYDEPAWGEVPEPVVLVDFTGEAGRLFSVYERLGTALKDALLVGYTHPGAEIEPPEGLTAPEPWIFFTPSEEQRLIEKEGEDAYRTRYQQAENALVENARSWLSITRRSGPEALVDTYRLLIAGGLPAHTGTVVAPR